MDTANNNEYTKTCKGCKEAKKASEFGKYKKTKDRLHYRCKSCIKVYAKRFRERLRTYCREWQRNKAKTRPLHARGGFVLRTYGITAEQYQKMLKGRDNKCDICKSHLTVPNVDHDHTCCPGEKSCGKCVRGILCRRCNSGLGMFDDSEVSVASALKYLQRENA